MQTDKLFEARGDTETAPPLRCAVCITWWGTKGFRDAECHALLRRPSCEAVSGRVGRGCNFRLAAWRGSGAEKETLKRKCWHFLIVAIIRTQISSLFG